MGFFFFLLVLAKVKPNWLKKEQSRAEQCSSLCLAFRPGLWICTMLLHALDEVSTKKINRGGISSFCSQNLVIPYYALGLL